MIGNAIWEYAAMAVLLVAQRSNFAAFSIQYGIFTDVSGVFGEFG